MFLILLLKLLIIKSIRNGFYYFEEKAKTVSEIESCQSKNSQPKKEESI